MNIPVPYRWKHQQSAPVTQPPTGTVHPTRTRHRYSLYNRHGVEFVTDSADDSIRASAIVAGVRRESFETAMATLLAALRTVVDRIENDLRAGPLASHQSPPMSAREVAACYTLATHFIEAREVPDAELDEAEAILRAVVDRQTREVDE